MTKYTQEQWDEMLSAHKADRLAIREVYDRRSQNIEKIWKDYAESVDKALQRNTDNAAIGGMILGASIATVAIAIGILACVVFL